MADKKQYKKLDPNDPRHALYKGSKWSIKELERIANLVPVKRTLDAKYPESTELPTLLDRVLAYKLDKEKGKDKEKEREAQRDKRERYKLREANQAFSGQVEQQRQKYLATYANPTPNDLAMIEQMAMIDVLLQELPRKFGNLLADNTSVKAEDVKSLVDTQSTLTTTHRQIQTTLGIARSVREGEELNIKDVVQNATVAAKTTLEKYGLLLYCVKCSQEEAHVKIRHGIYVMNFLGQIANGGFFQCPRCKAINIWTDNKIRATDNSVDLALEATFDVRFDAIAEPVPALPQAETMEVTEGSE